MSDEQQRLGARVVSDYRDVFNQEQRKRTDIQVMKVLADGTRIVLVVL
jgi:hypothetical protein